MLYWKGDENVTPGMASYRGTSGWFSGCCRPFSRPLVGEAAFSLWLWLPKSRLARVGASVGLAKIAVAGLLRGYV